MKKLFLSFCLLFFFSANLFAQSGKAEIENVVVRFFDGISELNDEKMRAEVTADFTLLEDGEIWTIDTLIHELAPMKGKGVNRVNSFRFEKTEQRGDLAWTYYHNTAEISFGEQKRTINWLESVVLRKEKGKWKIQLMHSTVKPK